MNVTSPSTILQAVQGITHEKLTQASSDSNQMRTIKSEMMDRIQALYIKGKDKAPKELQVFSLIPEKPAHSTHNETESQTETKYQLVMNMRGVAVAATYLKQKHQIEHLYVCKSLEDFQTELKRIWQAPEDCKAVFIVAVRTYDPKEISFEAKHKVAVGIEKKEKAYKIVILDSMNASEIDLSDIARIIPSSAEELEKKFVSMDLHLLWYISRCNFLDWENTQIHISNVDRQKHTGCESFALRDALHFLRNPHFFTEISLQGIFTFQNPQTGKARMNMFIIGVLPPEFMTSSQFPDEIDEYREKHPILAARPLYSSAIKAPQTLQQCISKHTVTEKKEVARTRITRLGVNRAPVTREEIEYAKDPDTINVLIPNRSLKYHRIVAEAFLSMPVEELNRQIETTFKASYKSTFEKGQLPQTLNDLHRLLRSKL